jgi:hypothetical protein
MAFENMSSAVCDDDIEEGSNVAMDVGRRNYSVADGCERSTVISSTCGEDLLETDCDDAILAERIIRTRTSLYRVNEQMISSQTSTEPMSSTAFEESSCIDSISESHGTSNSSCNGGNALSGYTARSLVDDRTTDSSPDSPEKSENAYPQSEEIDKKKVLEKLATLQWSITVDALPVLPRDTLQTHATKVNLPPLERRSTAGTMSTGQSDRTGDISAEMDEGGLIYAPDPDAIPIVAVPITSESEPVEAVAVSIVKRNEEAPLPTTKHGKTIVCLCLIAAIVIAVSAVVAAVCGSGGCSKGSTRREGNDELPKQPPLFLVKIDDRKLALFSYISNVTFGASLSPYQNDTTPEEQALNWLVDSDPLQLWPQNNSFRIRQRYALLTFWFNSNNTDEWINSTGWLDYDDECTWFGISCSEIKYGFDANENRTVTAMDLGFNSVSGIIPSDLGLLSNLHYLDLKFNQLYGSIPSSIGQLTDLEHLDIALNGLLTGRLPESVGNLHLLVHADFSYNLFTGELPSSIGNWTDLVYVDFSSLPINSTIPSSVGNWKDVEFVGFMTVGGDMHGTLPESIGNWVNIEIFTVVGNAFSGTLPPTIANWTNLHTIDLSFNKFIGTIPEGVLNWTSIEKMYLYYTELTGGVPEVMCTFPNLTKLEADCASRNFTCSCCTLCV